MEQGPLFLSAMWSFALVGDPSVASAMGGAYLFLRLFYPIIWLLKGGSTVGFPMQGFAITFPAYGLVVFMYLATMFKCCGIEIYGIEVMGIGGKVTTIASGIACGLAYMMYAIGICP